MKILHVINSLQIGGAEKLTVLLMSAMEARGASVDLLILNDDAHLLRAQLTEKGFDRITSLKIKNAYSPLCILRIRPFLRRYDVVHAHLFPTQYWVAIGSLGINSVKLVTTEHNSRNRRSASRFWRLCDSCIYRRYDAIVAVSEETENKLTQLLGERKVPIRTIFNGIDIKRFGDAQAADLVALTHAPENSRFIVQVSNFTEQKDHETLVRAVARLPPIYHLLLIGEGSREHHINQLVTALKINHRVHFLGVRSDIPEILKGSTIATLCSHYEGHSLALIEAFASGTPVIGSDSPGLGRLVRTGGVVVAQKNPDCLANAVRRLCEDSSFYTETGKRGKEFAKAFAIETVARHYLTLYEEVTDMQAT